MNDVKTKLNINLNSFDELEHVRETVIGFCRYYCDNNDEVDILEMSILEACHNAIRYGSKRKNKSLCELKLLYDNQSIKVTVKNFGKAYMVDEKEKFSIDQDFLQYKNGGLGIPLIKTLMDSVEYSRKSGNINELIFKKKLLSNQ